MMTFDAYAHNNKIHVKEVTVKRGQKIAEMAAPERFG